MAKRPKLHRKQTLRPGETLNVTPDVPEPEVRELEDGHWTIRCDPFYDWDDATSGISKHVSETVLDGYAIRYALIENTKAARIKRRFPVSLVLSFRPNPSVRRLCVIGIHDVPSGAITPGKTANQDIGVFFKQETPLFSDILPQTITGTGSLKQAGSVYACTLKSEYFTIEFGYDVKAHKLLRFSFTAHKDFIETPLPRRAPKRSRSELPDPDLPPDAEANRRDVKFQTRISKETAERVNRFLIASGLKRTDMTEQALQEFIDRHAEELGISVAVDGAER